jgi:hypothetical protein
VGASLKRISYNFVTNRGKFSRLFAPGAGLYSIVLLQFDEYLAGKVARPGLLGVQFL